MTARAGELSAAGDIDPVDARVLLRESSGDLSAWSAPSPVNG
jgi:hypothetical protein